MRAENVVTNSQVEVIDLPARPDGLECFLPEAKADGQSRSRLPSLHKESPRRDSLSVVPGRRQQRGFRQRAPVFRWSVFLSVFACGILIGTLLARPLARPAAPPPTPVKASAVVRLAPPSTPAATPPAAVRDERGTVGFEAPRGVDAVGGRGQTQSEAVPPSPRPRTAIPAHRGTLSVTSTPSGASVYVNNQLAGQTPLVMRNLAAGSRAVRVDLDGYARWSRGIQVVANESTTISAQLNRSQ